MRVGFITQLLWSRYGDLWQHLIIGIGGEVSFPENERVLEVLEDERIKAIPGVAFQLAVAQALSLQACDLIIAPDLNPGEDLARGSGQDPWVASFPETLATSFAGLPPVVSVSTQLGEGLESSATTLLLSLSHDPAKVRRVWEQNRGRARSPKKAVVHWARSPSENETVGLLSQSWHLSAKLTQSYQTEGVHVVSQDSFNPAELREEAWRAEARLVSSDAEVLGAARLMARKGSVARLLFVADRTSGSDAWLAQQLTKLVHKPLSIAYLQDSVEGAVTLLS